MDLSTTLKALRMQHDFKQEQVASALGIGRSTYTNFENGREPSLSLLCKLADLYGMSIDELVEHTVMRTTDDSRVGSKDHSSNDTEIGRDTWRQRVKKRKTIDMLLYLLYLLDVIDDSDLLRYAEEMLQQVMGYIIRNLSRPIQQKEMRASKEGLRLSAWIGNKLLSVCSELETEPAKKCLPMTDKENIEFSIFELSDPELVKKYFYVNLDEILQQK